MEEGTAATFAGEVLYSCREWRGDVATQKLELPCKVSNLASYSDAEKQIQNPLNAALVMVVCVCRDTAQSGSQNYYYWMKNINHREDTCVFNCLVCCKGITACLQLPAFIPGCQPIQKGEWGTVTSRDCCVRESLHQCWKRCSRKVTKCARQSPYDQRIHLFPWTDDLSPHSPPHQPVPAAAVLGRKGRQMVLPEPLAFHALSCADVILVGTNA